MQLPTMIVDIIRIKWLKGGLDELKADGITDTIEEMTPMKIPINTK